MELIPQDLNVLSRSFLTPDERPRMQEIFEVLQSCLLTEKYNCGAIESKYPRSFISRISVAVMKDPVVCSDGYSYEMEAAVNYRLLCSKSPVTGEVLENQNIMTNRHFSNALALFQEDLDDKYLYAKAPCFKVIDTALC